MITIFYFIRILIVAFLIETRSCFIIHNFDVSIEKLNGAVMHEDREDATPELQ